MDKVQAVKLIEQVFDQKFDEARFSQFCVSLFNDFDRSKATPVQSGNYVYEPYRNHIKSFKRIGQYISPVEEILDVLAVKVHGGFKLERTCTGLRNFAIEYLKRKGNRDTLLIAFYADDSSDWRLSFIKLEYKTQKDKKGKIKAIQEATSARRYSFLVGENEPCHTAKKQFLPLLAESEVNPDIADVEACFNIEKVTKEFFEQYKLLFLNLKENLDALLKKDKSISADFNSKGIKTEAFAKKLLGQIVFLYFIQKKGWLGVPKNESFGMGDRKFLKSLFKNSEQEKVNYFNAFLEPLFYEALAVQRSSADPSYYRPFDCRIPFLNGGLFEPIKDYDWKKTEINLPNEVFSNCEPTKDNDIGTGILDVFDRYNFTVKEDEPLDKEVAVDPEMLGKVFENLLEVKDRKSKGTYYTPREIVHYMCQESLINYLDTSINSGTVSYQELAVDQTDLLGNSARKQTKLEFEHKDIKISKDDIDVFIKNSHLVIADNRSEKNQRTWQLPNSIKTHARLFDKALADIKVCDPAIGSGAFPVGMLNEIVRARTALTPFIGKKETDEDRTQYHLKRECIQNSLYGVDIDDSAIDIAKLRLWLSLVVDEDSIQDIEPLPNLDYKVVCGNSLLGIPEGVMHNDGLEKEIEELKEQFFSTTNNQEKRTIRESINSKFQEIISSMKIYLKNIPDISFDFTIHFSEVYHAKGGFDIVIGNPPYGLINKRQNKASSISFTSAELDYVKKSSVYAPALGGMLNIFRLFIIKSFSILHSEGFFSEIFPLAFVADSSASNLRKHIINSYSVSSIDAFPERDNPQKRVFENAKMSVCILNAKRKQSKNSDFTLRVNTDKYIDQTVDTIALNSKQIQLLDPSNYTIPIISKQSFKTLSSIYQNSTRLSSIGHCYTGEADLSLNKALINENGIGHPLLRGAGVGRYILNKKMSQGEFLFIDSKRFLAKLSSKKRAHICGRRIVLQGITGVNEKTRLKMTIVEDGTFLANSVNYLAFDINDICLESMLCIFNSSILNFAFKCFSTNSNVNGYEVDNLPLPQSIDSTIESELRKLSKRMLDMTSKNGAISDLIETDAKIDAIVAQLYGITESDYQLILSETKDTFRITALNYFRDIQKGILK